MRNGKYVSSVAIMRDVICQSPTKGLSFLSWSEVNADDLNPTEKSGYERGPRGMDLIQPSSTFSIKCLRCVTPYIVRVSGEGTINRPMSYILAGCFEEIISKN